MKFTFLILILSFFLAQPTVSADQISIGTPETKGDLSLRKEIGHAINKGLTWLKTRQNKGGYWSQPEYPALTALVLTAYMKEPSGQYYRKQYPFIQKGYKYIIGNIQKDGGIYAKDMANYNTSVSMMALLVSSDSSYEPIIRRARNFLIGLQGDFNEKGKLDSPYDGGIGYGGRYTHSDMSSTMYGLEALYYTRFMRDNSSRDIDFKELNWNAVITFIQRSQNFSKYNDQKWASDDPKNKGGFVYFPGDSKAGEMKLSSGKTVLRSYGSMSYAGLLSYIYADMDKEDPRVKAVFEWLRQNYTLDENPGMDQQGLYCFYHTMAKALSIYGVKTITMDNGEKINWRKNLALKLIDLQKNDGFWVNDSGRWWKKDPVLVTSYALITLEILHRGL